MPLPFEELFRQRNLQILATEVYKSKYQISPVIMQKRFKACDYYHYYYYYHHY